MATLPHPTTVDTKVEPIRVYEPVPVAGTTSSDPFTVRDNDVTIELSGYAATEVKFFKAASVGGPWVEQTIVWDAAEQSAHLNLDEHSFYRVDYDPVKANASVRFVYGRERGVSEDGSTTVAKVSGLQAQLAALAQADIVERTDRQAADNNIRGGVTTDGDTLKKLNDKIVAAAQTRADADSALASGIATEAQTRADADSALASDIEGVAAGTGPELMPYARAADRIGSDALDQWSGAVLGEDGALIATTTAIRGPAIAVDPERSYELTAVVRLPGPLVTTARVGFDWYNKQGQQIAHRSLHYWPGSLTELSSPLAVGDTQFTVADASAWDGSLPSSQRGVAFGDYLDADGNQYGPGDYSAWVSATDDFVSSVDAESGVVTLSKPWALACPFTADGAWPAGQAVRQSFSGSSALYFDPFLTDDLPAGEYVLKATLSGDYQHTEVRRQGMSGHPAQLDTIKPRFIAYSANVSAGVAPELLDFSVRAKPLAAEVHEQMSIDANTASLMDGNAIMAQAMALRWQMQSGVLGARQYEYNASGTDQRVFDAVYSANSIHNHPDHRLLVGMAETAVNANGFVFETRHNDHVMMMPAIGDYLARDEVLPPDVPAEVLAKPTGLAADGTVDISADTQAKWVSDMLAGAHPEHVRADLAYMEVWLEKVDGGDRVDPADSTRHAEIAGDLLDSFEANNMMTLSGAKIRLENLGNYPAGDLPDKAEDGSHRRNLYELKYRINTVPVGTAEPTTVSPTPPLILIGTANSHVHELEQQLTQQQYDDLRSGAVAEVLLTSTDVNHTHSYRITWNSTKEALDGQDTHTGHKHAVLIQQGWNGALPFDKTKAANRVIDSTNQFALVYDPVSLDRVGGDPTALVDSNLARFDVPAIHQAMRLAPGLEGAGAVVSESYDYGGEIQHFNDINDPTNTPADPSLNAAYYTREAQATTDDASGRKIMHRGKNDPWLYVAKTTHAQVVGGVSMAIPLEIIHRTPVESWNPADLTIDPADYLRRSNQIPGSGTSAASPLERVGGKDCWNFTPLAIWSAATPPSDAADTPRELWMRGADGNAYECSASGVWIFRPDGQRSRFPCYPLAHAGSHAETHQRAINRALKALLGSLVGTAGITQADIDRLPIDDEL